MARPVLSETIIADDVAVIGGDLKSGSIRISEPSCEVIQLELQFAVEDITSPALVAAWMLQERKEGAASYGDLKQYRSSAIGAVDNDPSPSLMTIPNPFISTSPPKRRFFNSDLRLVYELAGREGGVTVKITARQLGADDGLGD